MSPHSAATDDHHLSLRTLQDFAVDATWQAGKITLEYFQTDTAVERKADASPVTLADRRAEEKLRECIQGAFPEHGILGEEFGEVLGRTPYRWVLDPLDGTRSFIQGVPLYGVMMGLEHHGRAVLGVVHFPALGETVYAAKGEGCYWNGRRAHVSTVAQLGDAVVLATSVRSLYDEGRGAVFEALQGQTRLQRTWGDCYGHILVATGRAEVMLDPILNIWDCAALQPILEEAGGTFTDWHGTATHTGGNGLSTNGYLFQPVMEIIRSRASSVPRPSSGIV
jgi:histidinol phosphatase-like enzyme (inositol monophosphatase family)